MQEITETQLVAMDDTLEELMNLRFSLTKVVEAPDSSKSESENENEKEINYKRKGKKKSFKRGKNKPQKKSPKKVQKKGGKKGGKRNHFPTLKWKEHFLSHLTTDIRNLGPLPLLNTGIIFCEKYLE